MPAHLAFICLLAMFAPLPRADAAFLFTYRPKPGMDSAFAAGYKRHLEWHAAKQDSLAWLAWTVVDGGTPGYFVDGVFGTSFEAMDVRVDPRGDARDAALNVTPYADAVSREVLLLRRDLSRGVRDEYLKPAAMQRVHYLTVDAGSTRAFETRLRELQQNRGLTDYAIYETVSGGSVPRYVMIVQLRAFRELDEQNKDPMRALLAGAPRELSSVSSVTWLHRPDLTYVPAAVHSR